MSDTLKRLRVLTEELTVRDKKRLEELALYQSFFDAIPVRTFVWSVDSNMNIRAKNKKSLRGKCSNSVLANGTINDAFSCDEMNKANVDYHKKALAGNKQTFLSYEDDVVFLTTLLPVDEAGETFVYGCSWDVTNLVRISDAVKLAAESSPKVMQDLVDIVDNAPVFKLIKDLGASNV